MSNMIIHLENILADIALLCTLLLELVGVCVLITTAARSFLMWIRKDGSCRLTLAEGIALALEFKMGGEVLRTVAVREWSELLILGAVITLRGLLTFLIHWEIKNEQKAMEKKQA